jgi:glyceraldehyde 3-phosphate dehydrogenase
MCGERALPLGEGMGEAADRPGDGSIEGRKATSVGRAPRRIRVRRRDAGMATKIGINGFGRIGRQVLKGIRDYHRDDLEVVAVNDLTDPTTNAHLFQYDSTYGRYPGKVSVEDGQLVIDGHRIAVLAERDPGQIPWGDHGVEIVIESTGFFTDGEQAKAHLNHGPKKVVISAPAKNDDLTIVLGVNDEQYDPASHHVVSNASCTTNCLAPVAKVLDEAVGIKSGIMSTIHAYTNDQVILDTVHSDLRRARAAGLNIIPTTTGAAKAVGRVLPHLDGKLNGMAYRVPTATVSVVDLTVDAERSTSAEEVNEAFRLVAEDRESPLYGILAVETKPLVSSDFRGHPASSIIDAPSTMVLGGTLVKVVSWYDNEWAYSVRVGDLCALMASRGL